MNRLIQLLLGLLLFSVTLGQLGRLPISWFGEGGIYISDLIISLIWVLWFVEKLKIRKFEITFLDFVVVNLLFILGISLINSLSWVPLNSLLIATFYYIRIILYFGLFVIIKDYFKTIPIKLLIWVGSFFGIAGIVQYLLFPNFAQFIGSGWDPHYYRVLSTFFDPNYAGLFYVFLFMYFFNLIYKTRIKSQNLIYFFIMVLLLIMLILTYSRSTYLAFIVTMSTYSIFKDRRIIIGIICLSTFAFIFIPRVQTRVIGAFTFDDTVSIRLNDYKKSLNLIAQQNQLLGVGFNNLRYTKETTGYFRDLRGVNQDSGHSGAGADSSLLFIFETSGFIGLFSYLLFLTVLIFTCYKSKENAFSLGICFGLIVHSQFVNSFFYIPILTLFIFLLSDNSNLIISKRIN